MTRKWTDAGLARLMNDVKKENGMDRELLELAAKAAGMDYLEWTPGASALVPEAHRVGGRIAWNPLTDDGDALRLAMDLAAKGLVRFQVTTDGVNAFYNHDGLFAPVSWTFETVQPTEAFRRAIVRAAAELGRAKS